MRILILIWALPFIAFADDLSPHAQELKARDEVVAQLQLVADDPKSTDQQRNAAFKLAVQLLNIDSKIISEDEHTTSRLIELSGAQEAQTATTTHSPVGHVGAWHEVARIGGSSDKNSEPFTITSGRWRVNWTTTTSKAAGDTMARAGMPSDSISMLSVEAVSEDTPKQETQDVLSVKTGSGKDSTELKGAGTWSLKVISANTDWTMVVEEFR